MILFYDSNPKTTKTPNGLLFSCEKALYQGIIWSCQSSWDSSLPSCAHILLPTEQGCASSPV